MKRIYLLILSAYIVNVFGQTPNTVGIGTNTPTQKLDVNGWIKVGNQTAPVPPNSHDEGSIRYNSTLKRMQFNDGGTSANWVSFARETDKVPTGVIVLWSGNFGSIPAGWVLCDGTNGTPDLRNRFVFGANVTGDVGTTGGNSSITLSTAQLPAHNHSGTTDATAPALTFSGTNASIGHTASFAGTNATITPTATFSGTSATTSTTNIDHTHNWGGVWNNDNSADGASPNGDGTSNVYSDGINQYWGMGSGNGITRTSSYTDVNHYHDWGNVWNADDSRYDGWILSDGWTYWNGGWTNNTGAWSGWHSHGYDVRGSLSGWGWAYASGSGGWGGSGTYGSNGSEMMKHRHYIAGRNTTYYTGGNAQNHAHNVVIPNHRHWIRLRASGAMNSNATHNHTVTATGNVNVTGASYTPAGSVTVNNASYTPAGTISGSSHTHTVTTGNTGSGSAVDIRPLFYTLAYIMKL